MMPLLAGVLRTEDSTRVSDIPLANLTDAINDVLGQYQEERDRALQMFVAETTILAEEHVPLGGIDEGQDVDRYGRALETRPEAGYDVAYPWIRRGWAHGWDYESEKLLTVGDVQRVLTAQSRGNAKWHLRSIHRALYNNGNWTHRDNEVTSGGVGVSRTIRALANQDGTLYPPAAILALGDDDTQANHYIVSNYLSSAINGTNNPLELIRAKIRARDVAGTIVAFINSAQLLDIRDKLPNFIDAPAATDATAGSTTPTAILPSGILVPGQYIGVDGDTNVHVYVYDSATPSAYILGMVIGRPPLKKRIPSVSGLQGFKLEAEEELAPLHRREFRDRAGYGVFDRLGAVVVQLKGSGSYDVPTIYQR